MELVWLSDDIFTVSELFTPDECADLIAKGESLGYAAASVTTRSGPQMMTNIRNNDRANFDDPQFAISLWERVNTFVPKIFDASDAVGLSEKFRFYRYDPGQRFKRHKDGPVTGPNGEISRLSFLIYLNVGYEGGETIFSDYTMLDGVQTKSEIIVTPHVGMGLFFPHERWHEGSPLIEGRKYLLRTDVLYSAMR